jgi:hypothetical protein
MRPSKPMRISASGAAAIAALLLVVLLASRIDAGVLDDKDFERIAEIKPSFMRVANDMTQSLRRPDISSGDSGCINSALRELLQIAEELASYEYLITIESKISDFGDDEAMKSIVRFAIDKALSILEGQRRRLNQVLDECSRFPLSVGKTQQAVQFIDTTAATLRSIRPRL